MEIIDFVKELKKNQIIERDFVKVSYFDNGEAEISGTLIPYSEIIVCEGRIESRIIHPKDGGIIVVKTLPDGIGPDIGFPIRIENINSILKN